MSYIVETRQLSYRYRATTAPALENVDLLVEPGTTLGLVGESGSGKSTLIRGMCGLLPTPPGTVRYQDRAVSDWLRHDGRAFRRQNQIVFQNPASSFDPRMTIATALAEPVKALERRSPPTSELVDRLEQVGLNAGVLGRHPRQLSGGQVQRIAIARALLVGPRVLYADEPTSALDVSVQAQVLNLLMDLQRSLGLTLVVVSHDLGLVSRVCDQIAVMLSGSIVEAGPTAEVLGDPKTPYSRQLLAAAELDSLIEEEAS
ncbi:ABC-type glutathione transport system ATPase component [Kribbella aluminosa]|uniref:ABC-type glutathione transport system ATPase component n=1 Tax=Kribbella aluminosa TaxID=416017 RepID=A0ABS4UDD3_9ACTN|nr:ATP-binding cassette domain-containing protein [Kribbella aluminosa]MBP2349641.1 ABC-type glutathione transport system ATPase component [Kribbella aluminosa]